MTRHRLAVCTLAAAFTAALFAQPAPTAPTAPGPRERPREPLTFTADNLAETFTRLEREGWSGVVHVRLGGQVVLERAFGTANADLKVPMALDTIFCTGSRPIEYTVAALYLLEQQGKLTLDDPLSKFFPDAPADKRTITLRQFASGQSGLPDFFHTAADWDADLAWVDRETAEQRLLALPLLFAPGSRREHSHAAFGLLAAVVERVSGQTYAAFLRQHLFTPAGMTRTGFYGESKGFTVKDFAVGGGPSFVGLPNIPPNWGPTSWLVQGSGGMFSTLPDQLRFYQFVRSGTVLGEKYTRRFKSPFITLDGSDRGFELFQAHEPGGNEAILMVNRPGGRPEFRAVIEGLERLIMGPPEGGREEGGAE